MTMTNTEIKDTIRGMLKMSQSQLDYALAKGLFDAIKDKSIEVNTPEDEIKRKEIEREYWLRLDNLVIAENNLLAWAKNLLQTKRPSDYAKVSQCFEKPIYNVELKQQLLDLCYKLDGRTV